MLLLPRLLLHSCLRLLLLLPRLLHHLPQLLRVQLLLQHRRRQRVLLLRRDRVQYQRLRLRLRLQRCRGPRGSRQPRPGGRGKGGGVPWGRNGRQLPLLTRRWWLRPWGWGWLAPWGRGRLAVGQGAGPMGPHASWQ